MAQPSCPRSVLAQITPDCEVVLVDDGSTDHSVNLVQCDFAESLESGKLTLTCTEDTAPAAARNTGVQAACGIISPF